MSNDGIDIEGGKTRMEVAYGAGDGDDEAKAIVASKEAELGTIFEQSYRPWDGELGPRWTRNYAIFRHTSTACSEVLGTGTTIRWSD